MPASIPSFNFLARLVSEIWGGSQNKKWELLISTDSPSGQICIPSVSTHKCLQVCQISKFQLPSSTSFRDKEGVQKFNVGATTPYRTPYAKTFVCAQSTWQGQTACQVSASHLYASCSYVFPIGLPLYVPKNGFFGGFDGEDVKILCSDHQKALPCVNTRLLMYRMSKSVQRPEL